VLRCGFRHRHGSIQGTPISQAPTNPTALLQLARVAGSEAGLAPPRHAAAKQPQRRPPSASGITAGALTRAHVKTRGPRALASPGLRGPGQGHTGVRRALTAAGGQDGISGLISDAMTVTDQTNYPWLRCRTLRTETCGCGRKRGRLGLDRRDLRECEILQDSRRERGESGGGGRGARRGFPPAPSSTPSCSVAAATTGSCERLVLASHERVLRDASDATLRAGVIAVY